MPRQRGSPTPKRTTRRRAPGGVRARSRSGDIGETWWSRRFVTVLESLTDGARLLRGRSYARSGQVLDVVVEAGVVTARVLGSRPNPYRVRILVTPLSEPDWQRAEEAMASQAIFLAALLAGEMPRDVERVFAGARLSLFPADPHDLQSECSCPESANPCEHVAATYYILAERFDEDPFLILAWRGRAKDALLDRLRERRDAVSPPPPRAAAPPPAPALPLGRAAFWTAGAELADLRVEPRAATPPDTVPRELGPAPVEAWATNLADLLVPAYRVIVAAASEKARA